MSTREKSSPSVSSSLPPQPAPSQLSSLSERARAWLAARTRSLRGLVWPSTLRWRLIGALLLAVVLAVSAETVSHMAESSDRLEKDLEAQGDRVSLALHADLD